MQILITDSNGEEIYNLSVIERDSIGPNWEYDGTHNVFYWDELEAISSAVHWELVKAVDKIKRERQEAKKWKNRIRRWKRSAKIILAKLVLKICGVK